MLAFSAAVINPLVDHPRHPNLPPPSQAHDKRLVAQPIALRALRKAGVIEANSPSGLASSLTDPSLVSHLTSCLAAAAGVPAEELRSKAGAPATERRSVLSAALGRGGAGASGTSSLAPDALSSALLGGSQLPRAEPRVANSSELRQQHHGGHPLREHRIPSDLASEASLSTASLALPAGDSAAAASKLRVEAALAEREAECDAHKSRGADGERFGERPAERGSSSGSTYSSTSTLPALLSLVAQNELLSVNGGLGTSMRSLPPYRHSSRLSPSSVTPGLPGATPRVV